ncbi:TlpA family protein disulfide reductase [Jannaschia sp. Os4]|uniref:TlpA family protein disulfide reductase n=1 Tax=Jannaschia sp. Os4 TaxID=2807617 RepID=UPI00193A2CD4|nr:TlpA disulfide reductase family protein [Jannaschia sp. Os4]MBM2577449.1 TlpA family protein disulfide reductase [Jannaschia sp. Os4]
MPRLSVVSALAYLAALLLATPTAAGVEEARAVAEAEGVPLVWLEPTVPAVTTFEAAEGEGDLSRYAGQVAVVNWWATWCAPCREEMPSFQALADAMPDVAVVPLAFGRHNPAAMQRFWDEAGITSLPLHRDAGDLARSVGVKGLPHTVVLDPEGRVVAELIGITDWAAPSMQAVLAALAE